MYQHENDGFEEFVQEQMPPISIAMPVGETVMVSGIRQNTLNLVISKNSERNPKRDAKILAAVLSTSLDEQTIFYLAEILFNDCLAPVLQERNSVLETLKSQPVVSKVKKTKLDDASDTQL